MTSSQKNLDHYDANAKKLADMYNSVDLPESLPCLFKILGRYHPNNGNALDLGCGAGGDAYWLAKHGWSVVGVDGSIGLLEKAREAYQTDGLEFRQDFAPHFSTLSVSKKKFDVILLAAFIFHFNKQDRQEIFNRIFSVMKDSAIIHITLRSGPTPEGRIMYDVFSEEIEGLAKEKGLCFKEHGNQRDSLGRDDVFWVYVSCWCGEDWNHAKDIIV